MKKHLSNIIRIIISILFIISAFAKITKGWIPELPFIKFAPNFAISTFEVKQLYPLGFSENVAPWFSRILIGIEMALGLLILQNHFVKKIIIPSTILLLAVFVGHLSYVTFLSGGNTGNCGCFGELIPMTPIEAIIKNIVAIGLLIWLYFIITEKAVSKFWILPAVTLATIVGIFILAPITKSTNDFVVTPEIETEVVSDTTATTNDSVVAEVPVPTEIKKDSVKKDPPKKVEEVKVIPTDQPLPKKSGYAKFFKKIDSGRKTLCFFVPGCDHCRLAAKQLTEMKKNNKDFPEILVLFMNEEANLIPDFFKEAGATYPYKIIEIIPFWNLLGTGKDTPGVKYLWNGNEYKYYFGITDNKFNPEDYQTLINKPFSELK